MHILEMTPEELIEPGWLETYRRRIELLEPQLAQLNASIQVLGRIEAFPYKLLEPASQQFWELVENALLETCVMTIWRVAIDKKSATLTIGHLKSDILKHFAREEYARQLRAVLKECMVEKAIHAFRLRIEDTRHNYIAHFNLLKNSAPDTERAHEKKQFLAELRGYAQSLNAYFKLLCFAGARPAAAPTGSLTGSPLDVDRIFDAIAKNSVLVNSAENNPVLWGSIRDSLSSEEIAAVNAVRKKFGLPAA